MTSQPAAWSPDPNANQLSQCLKAVPISEGYSHLLSGLGWNAKSLVAMHSRVCGWYMHCAVQWEERFTKAEQTTLLQFNQVCTQTTLLALPSSKSFIAFLFQTSLQVNINETTLSVWGSNLECKHESKGSWSIELMWKNLGVELISMLN